MINKCIPCAPNMVAFTVDKIFSWVPIVGILSQTCNKFCLKEIHLSKYLSKFKTGLDAITDIKNID